MHRSNATFSFALLASAACAVADVTVDFPAIQDTWANENKATRNYGSRTTMVIRHSDVKIPYLQFEAHGITGPIISAALHFRITGDTGTLSAHAVSSQTWDESSLKFTNKPAWAATAAGSTSFTSTGWKSVDVTSAVSGDGQVSFALLSTDLLNADISTRESADVPFLRVVYQDVNQPPSGQPESYNVIHNTLRTVAAPGVLANDLDPNGDPLTAALVVAPVHGALQLQSDGSFTYLPDNGFSGSDTFTYQAVDDHGGSSLPSDPVAVTLNVLSSNDSQITPEELARIEEDLGVSLSVDQQLELAAIVKPITTEPWRSDAEARIDQHRKADLAITVLDDNGSALPGATVQVRLKHKSFKFGGIADLGDFSLGWPGGVTAEEYRALIPTMFDAVGLNNGLKPKLSAYQNPPVNTDRMETEFFPWCAANDMPVRGHLLIWPGRDHMSAPVEAKVVELEEATTITQQQIDELRALVDGEISAWATRWGVNEWDVMNEPLANHRIQDLLGTTEPARWFQLSQTNAPSARRLINEFQIISGKDEARFAPYKAEIQMLLDENAPITGIGFQSRFKFRREHPSTIYSRLEQFAGYNLDLVGTEFEVISDDATFFPDETTRALMTEEIMTTYFSHPKVTGFHAWDFLEDTASALVTETGTVKLNGLVWYFLNRLRYDTRATLVTDAQGRVELRGYKGEYEIAIGTGGTPEVHSYLLESDADLQIGTEVSASATHTIDAVEDTFAQEANPNNPGNFQTIQLRNPDGSVGRVGYLKFELTQVVGPVVSAKLVLHDISEVQGIRAMSVASNDWAESTLTWNTRPPTGGDIGTAAAPAVLPGLIEIPLDTAAVTTGGMWSLAITETGNSFGMVASTEDSTGYEKPRLVLVTGAAATDSDADGIPDAIDPDDDNDGIPDEHEVLLGLDPLLSSDAAADGDIDGFPNFLEYALGGSITVSTPASHYLSIAPAAGGNTTLTLRRRAGLPGGIAVRIAFSGDLASWDAAAPEALAAAGFTVLDTSTSVENDLIGPVETLSITLAARATPTWFRAQVTAGP